MNLLPHRSNSVAWDFFIQLLMIVALYVCTVSAIILLFQYVNVLFPDVLATPTIWEKRAVLDAIRWTTAILIIFFPVFLATSSLIERTLQADSSKGESRLRRWLLALTLFITAVAIIIDLVTLVYNFLSGELTVRFLLKTLIVAAITGTVFGYYLWDFRRTSFRRAPRLVTWPVSAGVVIAIVAGFFLVGSPFAQRNIRLDQRRVEDLSNLQYRIVNLWQSKESLPASLEELADPLGDATIPVDPLTAEPYEYRATGDLTFELCAVFQTEEGAEDIRPTPVIQDPYGGNWNHGIGRTCFSRTIDPEIYPPFEKPVPRRVP